MATAIIRDCPQTCKNGSETRTDSMTVLGQEADVASRSVNTRNRARKRIPDQSNSQRKADVGRLADSGGIREIILVPIDTHAMGVKTFEYPQPGREAGFGKLPVRSSARRRRHTC